VGVPYTPGDGIIDNGTFIKSINSLIESNKIDFVKKGKELYYLNAPAGFDIETSSFYENNDEADPHNKRAIMYHWQFGAYNLVTTGRTWAQFKVFLFMLSKSIQLDDTHIMPIYIHNLPYEWGFMRKHFIWNKVFLLDDHKPAYALMKSTGLEFRDSLILWGGKSLERVGKDLQRYKILKMKGDLDYSLLRTPSTPLTEEELKYCENDIRVILAGIQEEIEDNGDITKIPLTNTQRVRIYTRKKCYRNYKEYRKLMKKLTLDVDEYRQLKRAFQGGFVHANSHYVKNADDIDDSVFIGHTLKNVSSIDFASKYPSVMVLRKFPMSESIIIDKPLSRKEFESLLETHCCLFDLKIGKVPGTDIGGVRPRFLYESMWSASKCHPGTLKNPIINNGRVYRCDEMKVTVTELDYKALRQYYDWDYEEISNLRVYEKNYLPKDFVLAVLDLYERKTKLKGIHEELANYMIAKNMLNATYGMSVTDIFKEEIIYTMEGEYKKLSEIEKKPIDEYVSIAIDTYNKNGNRFLFYPWGVWIAAWARYDILSAITHFQSDYVYSDTDSVKFLNYEKHKGYIKDYNDKIMKEIEKVSKERNIPIKKFIPEKDGKKYPIGMFDYEGSYDLFKTQGAKRYMTCKFDRYNYWMKTKGKIPEDVCLDDAGNEYVLTLAGASKIGSMKYLIETFKKPNKIFNEFTSNMVIPEEYSGRKILTYVNSEVKGTVVDYKGVPYDYHELSFIHMENSKYEMSLNPSYMSFLYSLAHEVFLEGKK